MGTNGRVWLVTGSSSGFGRAIVEDAVAAGDVRARFDTLGIESADWGPAEFDAFVRGENAAWRPLIRELGIRLDS